MKSKETVRLIQAYGPLLPTNEYEVIGSGYDYVKVKVGGHAIHVPTNLIDDRSDAERRQDSWYQQRAQEELEEAEDTFL